ncbi:phage tail protein [Pseudomonas putida]|uniref:phage tail protein n=1 Tax=Pseudomonas putida TaxID=303 RepID=UPI0018D9A3EF|nr:phage tail protein [Pseudomonas putida]MBH3412866.1 phage tail protein [Pseudomonas putida]
MPWYRSGTGAITAGQTSVVGTNTDFAANARVGDAFQGPDGRWYEVANVASATVLSILPAYQGATVSAGGYGLAPMQGYPKDAADALRALTLQFGNKLAALGTTGNYDILPVAKGGTGATDAATALANIGGQTKANSLTALSFPTFAADQLPYFSGSSSSALTPLTSFGRSLIDDANAAAGRTTLGLGSSAVMPILGAVGQASGVPTGAVIERGSNANGEYVRFADGTQICTRTISAQKTLGNAAGALYFQAKESAALYPIGFAAAPAISIQATGFTYEVFWLGGGWSNPTSAWPSGYVMTEVQRTQSDLVYITYTATGRWF